MANERGNYGAGGRVRYPSEHYLFFQERATNTQLFSLLVLRGIAGGANLLEVGGDPN